MKKKVQRNFMITAVLFLSFLLFTVLVMCVDVQPIGPEQSEVGFASLNGWLHDTIGVHEGWYDATKYLGMLVLLVAAGFAALGATQFLRGGSVFKVDVAIVLMGAFYILVGIAYVLFEVVVINYRPEILDVKEGLEASYPSSHTVLAVCILSSAMIYVKKRIKDVRVRNGIMAAAGIVMAVIVIGRLISGVHWFTDILGGVLLSAALVMLYYSMLQFALSVKKGRNNRTF